MITRDEAIRAAAEIVADELVRIETEKAVAAAAAETPERAA